MVNVDEQQTQAMLANARPDQPAFGAMFNVDEIKRANAQAGYHFFDADSMRFFRSRVLDGVYGGRFFITSEKNDGPGYSYPRLYTVREFMPDGSIDSLGEFQAFSTPAQARRAIKEALTERHAYYFEVQHGKKGRVVTYVITASDPWAAAERLHKNARIRNCGRARDYMLNEHAERYTHLAA